MHDVHSTFNWWGLGSQYADNPAFGWYLITFAIFVGGLVYAIRRPLMLYLEVRSKEIGQAIFDAKIAKEKAEKQLFELQERLTSLDSEMQKIKAEFERQGQFEKADAERRAKLLSEAIARDAEEVIVAELARAKRALQVETARISVQMATETLKATGTLAQEDLFHAFTEDVSKTAH